MMKKVALVVSVLKFKLESRGIRESDHLSVCILFNLTYSMRWPESSNLFNLQNAILILAYIRL